MAKKVFIVTPAGRAIYPHLHAADTKFDAAGVYSTKQMQEPSAERDSLVKHLEAAFAESVTAAKKENPGKKIKEASLPWVEEVDSEGNETGNLIFNYKLKASGMTREKVPFTQSPKLFDSKGNPLPAGTKIGGGSIIKVAFEINSFYVAAVGAGIGLRLKAVQVLDLHTWGEGNAKSYGFGEEEGFEQETMSANETVTPEVEAGETPEAPAKDAKDSSDF